MCSDESSNLEGPFYFIYSTVFRRLDLRLPFTPFERALLTEVNVAPAQLLPNSWAFVRAFTILCHYLGHMPSVDVFMYFFEAKSLGQKLWVSFNGVPRKVLLTLFQQSYKGFKKHFFKVRCNRKDLTLLDGYPLYCATSFLVCKHRLTRWSCSSLSSALRPSRVILVSCLTLLFLVYLHIVLIYFLCIVVFLCRHGVKRGEEEDVCCCSLQAQSWCRPI